MTTTPPTEDERDPFDTPEYAEFVAAQRKHCRCCECTNPPCAGVLAGGMCDGMCFCRKDDFDDDRYSEDDNGDTD